MLPIKASPRLLAGLLAVLGAALVLATAHLLRDRARLSAELSAARHQAQRLRAANEELARQVQALRAAPAEPETREPLQPASQPKASTAASNLEQARLLAKLQDELSSAGRFISELETRLGQLQEQLSQARAETKRLVASEQELREKLAGSERAAEALQAELRASNDRLAELEAASLALQAESRRNSEEASRVRNLLRQLEAINRRRETYSASLMRRYREVNEHLRILAPRPETAGEGRVLDATELSRLQTALAAAEEDLRQLATANAQALQLERKLAGR